MSFVMSSEPEKLPDRDQLAELDRQAWNLPRPPAAPAGPARDVWPVRQPPSVEHETDPAAA